MSLHAYRRKRTFHRTTEPRGASLSPEKRAQRSNRAPIFVIHKHDASHLHYDLRLEIDGVLKSWAIPKGPINDPDERRLAARTEDHPFAYRVYEGVIPVGEYGAGPSMLWDRGTYTPLHQKKFTSRDVSSGTLEFALKGKKLTGTWVLFRFKTNNGKELWILKKTRKDPMVGPRDVTKAFPRSVKTNRTMREIVRDDAHG